MATQKTTFSEKLISGLRKAAVELEEFRLQAALGRAEARDAYESAKKKLNLRIHNAKLKLDSTRNNLKDKKDDLKSALEHLQLQLSLGKAETKERFESQRKQIARALQRLEDAIRKNKITNAYYIRLQEEIEKFRIKLEILRLQYDLNKIAVKQEFENRKKEFSSRLIAVRNKMLQTEKKAENKWEHFRKEVRSAYTHLKKAVVA